MTLYSTYSDAAGKPSDGLDQYCVVAGFSSTVAKWENFASLWNDFLEIYEIPFLQMSSLNARKGVFSDERWNDPAYMDLFLDTAASLIRKNVLHWAAAAVKYSDFEKISKVFAIQRRFNPYAMCGATVALNLQGRVNALDPPRAIVQHFFEEGDHGFGMIQKAVCAYGLNEPIRRPGKPKADCPDVLYYVQFQASDWLAFETRKFAGMSQRRFRASLVSLLRGLPGNAAKWDVNDLGRFCQKQNIPRYER